MQNFLGGLPVGYIPQAISGKHSIRLAVVDDETFTIQINSYDLE
jgi:hypothetical protein